MPQGAAVCGDRGGQIDRGPRRACTVGHSSTFHRRKVDRKAAGGPLYQGRNAPRNPPFAHTEDAFSCTPARVCRGPCLPGKAVRSERPPLTPCLPLTREVASPKGLTEGEIRRAYCKARMLRGSGLRILSLSRLRRQLPRQREPRGWSMPANRPLRGSQAPPGDEGRETKSQAPPGTQSLSPQT